MNLSPVNQRQLYGLKNEFNQLTNLYNKNKLPNRILLSGQKGFGKCTLVYHLTNYILSNDEEHSYNHEKFFINENNKSFKLIQNGSNPNFYLIDVAPEKKSIEISQIRNLIDNMNKSSFNMKPRLVLIDNIEFLNLNSINALLKILEEPTENIFFFLIHNNKKILSTLKSRCLNFKVSLTRENTDRIIKSLLDLNINELINNELLDNYYTPGKIYNLLQFANDNDINLKNLTLEDFLKLIINKSYYKKNSPIKYMIYDFVELFLSKDISFNHSYFLDKINNTKKFNLDEETLLLEFKSSFLDE